MRYYYITDSKADIENFKEKFGVDDKGRDIYSLFIKYKDRLKNHGISADITYHTKHTSKEEMLDILYRMDNQSYENEKGEISKNNYRKVYENNNWRIVEPLDWQTSMALGEGTTWCITGRYDTNGEVKPSQAKQYFNEYLNSYYETYYFAYDKKNGKKYCICPRTNDDIDIWNEEDKLVKNKQLLPLIGKEGIKSMGLNIILPDENGFVIENGVLTYYEGHESKIVIPNGVKIIGKNAFYGCDYLQSVTISNGVEEIGENAFIYCRDLQSVTIPGGVERIGAYAFYICDSLRSITIPNGVEEIEKGAFAYCHDLQSVTIPASVKIIELGAFEFCDSLQSITIPNGVEKIEHVAFSECDSLQSIIIPSSVKEIEAGVFRRCYSLQSIYVNDEKTADIILKNNPELKDKIVLR